MATDYYRKHSPPGRDVGKAKDCKTAGCKIRLIGIALVLTWLCVSGLFASGTAPYKSGPAGPGTDALIEQGHMVYHFVTPATPCTHQKVTIFGNQLKTISTNDKNNLIAPTGSSFAAVAAHFSDIDFFVSDQGEYTPWQYNDSKYDVTSSGYPLQTLVMENMPGMSVGSLGISGNMTGVLPKKYPVTVTVTDNGSQTYTGMADPPVSFDFDLWVIDLAEKSGTISIPDEEVYEIDLTAIPGDFPHENVCYISVSWFGALPSPGQTVSSHLYTDPACNNAITEDSGSYCAKKWLYGDPDTPTRIYYKHPQDAIMNDTIYVSLVVNNNPIIQKQLMFKKPTTAIAKYIDGIVEGYGRIRDYWDGSHMLFYPYTEWEDDDEDGYNDDRIGIVSDDSNRPFVFSLSSNNTYFRLNAAAFKAFGNGTLSGSYSFSSARYGFSGSGTIPDVGNEGCYWLPISSVYGDQFTKIDADTETIDWTIGNDYIRTKHPVYVIGGQLTEENDYHTLIDLGCKAARGLDNTNTAAKFTSIWNKYATLGLYRIDDQAYQTKLKYWGETCLSMALNNIEPCTIPNLLHFKDGNCVAWSEAFIETLRLQGVTGSLLYPLNEIQISVNPYSLVYYDNEEYTVFGFLQKATSAQGGSISNLETDTDGFVMHSLVQYGDDIYDIGTGLKYSPPNLYTTAKDHYVKTALKVKLMKNGIVQTDWVDAADVEYINYAIY